MPALAAHIGKSWPLREDNLQIHKAFHIFLKRDICNTLSNKVSKIIIFSLKDIIKMKRQATSSAKITEVHITEKLLHLEYIHGSSKSVDFKKKKWTAYITKHSTDT